jgi:hypothetical protein
MDFVLLERAPKIRAGVKGFYRKVLQPSAPLPIEDCLSTSAREWDSDAIEYPHTSAFTTHRFYMDEDPFLYRLDLVRLSSTHANCQGFAVGTLALQGPTLPLHDSASFVSTR